MRIIAGSCKGRPILAPKGMDTRPTLDRVKESLFGIIQFQLYGKTVLDLFAGSGNLGLEALSRGASFAAFNDMSRDAVKVIRANIEKLGFEQKSVVMNVDFAQAIRSLSARRFDIVFLDPPYRAGLMEKALKEQAGEDPLRREGYRDGTWVLLDYGCVCVHVFSEEAREFYSLERLWHDGKPVDLSGVLTAD